MKKIFIICLLIAPYCPGTAQSLSDSSFLLVVDVQDQFYRNTAMEEQANEMVENINRIIAKTDPNRVIYVKAAGRVLTISFKGIRVEVNDSVAELDTTLILVNDKIFTKIEADAFTEFDLNEYLIRGEASEIIIVGLLAERCIYHTAIGGMEKGYKICVVPEAILSKSDRKKKKVLKKLAKRGIRILPMDELLNAN